MAFYDLDKPRRHKLVEEIGQRISNGVTTDNVDELLPLFSDEDTYIRKTAYLVIGKMYQADRRTMPKIIRCLDVLAKHPEPKVRQTAVNAAGEIGKVDFYTVLPFFEDGLFDEHHSVRNAVIGSMKKMGEKNPIPVLEWSRKYLQHPDKEIRREICHGIELRGRTHPQDILPLLRELQFDKTHRVRSTLVHVIGQIAYKKGCLEKVMGDLAAWENQELATDAAGEIADVHHRYRNFSYYTQAEAIKIIRQFGYQVKAKPVS